MPLSASPLRGSESPFRVGLHPSLPRRDRHARPCSITPRPVGIFPVRARAIRSAHRAGIPSAQPEAERLTTLRFDLLTQLARRDAAQWEIDLISAPRRAGLTIGSFKDPTTVVKELRPVLAGDYESVRNRLTALDAKAKARREEARKEWAEVVRSRVEFRQYAEHQQAAYGFDFESGSQAGNRPNVIDAALVGWALVALLVAMRLRMREKRLEFAHACGVRTAVACLVAIAHLPGCGGTPSDGRPWAAPKRRTDACGRRCKLCCEQGHRDRGQEVAGRDRGLGETRRSAGWRCRCDRASRRNRHPRSLAQDLRGDAARRPTRDRRRGDACAVSRREGQARRAHRRGEVVVGRGGGHARCVAVVLLALCVAPLWSAARRNRAALKQRRATVPALLQARHAANRAARRRSKTRPAVKRFAKKPRRRPPRRKEIRLRRVRATAGCVCG